MNGKPERELVGRVALITGAGSGIGQATALRMADEGARIVVCDLSPDAVQHTMGLLGAAGNHLAIIGNISDETSVDDLVARSLEWGGQIDIVVNSAGISEAATPAQEQSIDRWRHIVDTNLAGTYIVSRAVGREMVAQGSGVILNLNSIAGVLGLPLRSAYSASKAGVGMLTRVLASEWAPHGVRVNAVAPGYIRTRMTEKLLDAGVIDEGRIRRRTPAGKMGTVENVADALFFLASDRASFITGVTLPVDGGYMAFGAPEDAYPEHGVGEDRGGQLGD
jgi:NAD(P)-dependent dehydrogenase (short-subunit alcohol dehydrogenase family)